MPLLETVHVVNTSGVVVGTGNHLKNIFVDARQAYKQRKSEIADRRAGKGNELPVTDISSDEDDYDSHAFDSSATSPGSETFDSMYSGSPSRSDRSRPSHDRPRDRRTHLDPKSARDVRPRGYAHQHSAPPEDADLTLAPFGTGQTHPEHKIRRRSIGRRNTDADLHACNSDDRPKPSERSASTGDDPESVEPPMLPKRKKNDLGEYRNEVSKLQRLLDEANCVQHSVTSTVSSLQKNPDQLAAVALTLAKISSLAKRMPPGAVMAMRGAFPAVVALLLSPQFMVATGVSVGVTVIALGGYKIVKRIKRKKGESKEKEGKEEEEEEAEQVDETDFDELQEIDSELKNIDTWRQGYAGGDIDDTASQATTVEAEYVTPAAGRHLISEGILRREDLKVPGDQIAKSSKKKRQQMPVREKSGSSQTVAKLKSIMNGQEGSVRALFKGNTNKSDPALVSGASPRQQTRHG